MGWTNNLYTIIGVIAGAITGVIKSMYCNGGMKADIVPADMAINSAIAAAWDLADGKTQTKLVQLDSEIFTPYKSEDVISIFNYVSSIQNPLTWVELRSFAEPVTAYPSSKAMWHYCFCYNKHRLIHNIYITFLHLFPAIFMDTGARIIGKKPRMWKTYSKIHNMLDVVAYFTTKQWIFSNDIMQDLWKRMGPQDKRLFKFDVTLIDWRELLLTTSKGVKLYIFKEPLYVEEAVARCTRLKYIHYTVLYLFRLLVLYVAYQITLHYWISCKDSLLGMLQ